MIHRQVVIVGGGPVGLSLALLLAGQGKKVVVLDPFLDKQHDGRVLALSYASYVILQELAAWPVESTPIDCVQISHGGLGVSNITAQALKLAHLGFTVKYSALCAKLLIAVKNNNLISLIAGEVLTLNDAANFVTLSYSLNTQIEFLTADLVILAEGGKLLCHQPKKIKHDYQQQALCAHISTAVKFPRIAYERFAKLGPLVLLPYADHYVLVWSLSNQQASEFRANPNQLCRALDQEFTQRLGGATILGSISSFPLTLSQANKRLLSRVVLVGNSAQTVHPVSAQGLNLGLRDIVVLSELLSTSPNINLDKLQVYDRMRSTDANAVIGFTHFLAKFMEPNPQFFKHIRGAGIIGLSNLPLLQNCLAKSLIFGV